MNEAAIILKRDAGGRVVVAEQQRVDLVRAYERSGLSGPKFAALAGVNYQTFATWRRKHGTHPPSRRRASPGAVSPTWVEAELRPDSGEGLTVVLPKKMPGMNGTRLRPVFEEIHRAKELQRFSAHSLGIPRRDRDMELLDSRRAAGLLPHCGRDQAA